MISIYILKLQQNKFYIGKTCNSVFKRFNQHLSGMACCYTKKFKPIDIYEVIPQCDKFDEDKYVLIYMNKFGIDNVRGGSYCSETIDSAIKNDIIKRIATANDLCFTCYQKGHFSDKCGKSPKL